MAQPPDAMPMAFEDDFDGAQLSRASWLPHYLPAWSSLAASRATYELRDSCLRLSIPAEQPLWCGDDHTPPLRVSGVQSGNYSGPVGSTRGQQPYREGLVVREEQEPFWGWTPWGGELTMRARAILTPRSMVSFWFVGLEDRPERSAEICVMEVFGDAVEPGVSAAVGMGLHRFRDPRVPEDFAAVRLPIDVAELHDYGARWTEDRVELLVDGQVVRSCAGPPWYPMQAMLAVFDFPDRASTDEDYVVPALVVDHVGQRTATRPPTRGRGGTP